MKSVALALLSLAPLAAQSIVIRNATIMTVSHGTIVVTNPQADGVVDGHSPILSADPTGGSL